MEIKLAGIRALVTGANSGIGEVIALALADAGLNDRRRDVSRIPPQPKTVRRHCAAVLRDPTQ